MTFAGIQFIRLCQKTVLITLTLFATTASAHNKVVVIPMSGNGLKPLKNVVTVAKANGDYSDPVAALDAITDAAAANPYLIVIAPGVYTVTSALIMKPWVDVAGSGQDVTFIKGAVSSSTADKTSAIIYGTNAAELSDVTVENTGGNTYSIAICNYYASSRLTRVTATANGGTNNYAVYNSPSSSPTLTQVTATASGGTNNYGIYNYSYSSPTMTQVTATASGGTNDYGLYNYSYSSPTMTQVTATANGGTTNYGVYNGNHSSPTMMQVTATASGGTNDYGIYNWDTTAMPFIRNSLLKGSTNGVRIGSSGTRIVNTRIEGGVLDFVGTQCLGTYDQDLNIVNC